METTVLATETVSVAGVPAREPAAAVNQFAPSVVPASALKPNPAGWLFSVTFCAATAAVVPDVYENERDAGANENSAASTALKTVASVAWLAPELNVTVPLFGVPAFR